MFADHKVRFSQFSALNDPFEFAVDVDEIGLAGTISGIIREKWSAITAPQAMRAQILDRTLERFRTDPRTAVVFSQMSGAQHAKLRRAMEASYDEAAPQHLAEAQAQLAQILEGLPKVIGDEARRVPQSAVLVFSCSANSSSVPMWAHYASNHTGFQIGFAPNEMFGLASPTGKAIKPFEVKYNDRTPNFGPGMGGMEFVIQKMGDWAYEKEWRYLWTVEKEQTSDTNHIHLFDYNIDAVREVTLALNASAETEASIRSAFANSERARQFFRVMKGKRYGFERVELAPLGRLSSPLKA